MPKIIAFVSPKGGCGATSVCGLLWYALSKSGLKVLGLDMCFQGASLDFILGKENDYIYTLSDVMDGSCRLDEVCDTQGSAFLRGGYDETEFDSVALGELIKNSAYDYVLMDCCARYSVPDFADRVALVTDTSPVSVRLCEEFAENTDNVPVSVVINKIIPSCIDDGVHPTVDEILDSIGCELLGLVPMDMYVNYVSRDGFDTAVDGSCLYECFLNIASRLGGSKVPAYDIDGFFRNGKAYKYLAKGRK